MNMMTMSLMALLVGFAASFSGLGGGFLMVPLLLFLGYSAQKAVGTSFLAIMIIAMSALFAHGRLGNVDYKVGAILGFGWFVGCANRCTRFEPCIHRHVSKNICSSPDYFGNISFC